VDLRNLAPISRWRTRLEPLAQRPLVAFVLAVVDRDKQAAGTLIGAAIAFRMFLFFIPLLLFVVGITGFVAELMDVERVTDTTGVTGELADQIRAAFEQSASTRWVATLTGLVGMATTGRSLSRVMSAASSLAWQIPVVLKASVRIVGAVVGLVAGLALSAAIVNRVRLELGLPAASLSFLAVFVVYLVVWAFMFWLLPRSSPDPGILLPGAAIMAVVQSCMQLVSQLYLPVQIGRASALYGGVGTAIVTLGWFFFLGRSVVIAMAVNATVHERYGSISDVVFALPIVRLLPPRSATIRRVFGLDTIDTTPEPGDATG
jgi:membrane protein